MLIVLAVLIAAAFVLFHVWRHRTRGPHRLPRVLPLKLTCRGTVDWRERPFLGWGRDRLGVSRFAFGTNEDSVGVVGPPRVGKTAGVLIPQAAMWAGALVSTSTKVDVFRATAGRRQELARQHGGSVYVYAPTAGGNVEGLRPVRWSPLAGCQNPRIANLRVETLVQAAQTGRGIENADHWRAGACRILRPYFLAASHHPSRPGDFSVVREWLAGHEFRDPLAILEALGTAAGDQWASELRGVAQTPDKERGSFFSAAHNALSATADPNVLDACSGTDLDPVEFLTTRSTLYIVSPSEHQEAVAPLISALIESIVNTAYGLYRDGRLPARLLLSLDELANIAPLPSLQRIVSEGAGQGVLTAMGLQSLAQLRDRYGEHAADAIWSATRSKLVFGGLADGPTLDQLSRLVGDHRVETRNWSFGHDGNRHETRGHEWRPRLSPSQLRELPPSWAVLLHHGRKPLVVRAPILAKRRRLRRAVLPWPPAMPVPAHVVAAGKVAAPVTAPVRPVVAPGPITPPPATMPRLHVVERSSQPTRTAELNGGGAGGEHQETRDDT